MLVLNQVEIERLFTQQRSRGKHMKTWQVLACFIMTCAGHNGLPSQRKRLWVAYRAVQRSSPHSDEAFHVSAFALLPTQNSHPKESPEPHNSLAPLAHSLDGSWLSCCQGSQSPSFPSASVLDRWEGMGKGDPRAQGTLPLLDKLEES